MVSHVAQNGLGGHSIPLDTAMMGLFYVLGIVTREEAHKAKVSGLERTIPKAKGAEFFNLVHQLAVEFASGPFKPAVRAKITKLCPAAKERFPKRGKKILEPIEPKKPAEPPAEAEAPAKKEAAKAKPAKATKATKPVKKKAAAKPAKKAKAVKKATKKDAKKTAKKGAKKATKKVTKKKKVVKKKASKKKVTKKKSPSKSLKKKKPR